MREGFKTELDLTQHTDTASFVAAVQTFFDVISDLSRLADTEPVTPELLEEYRSTISIQMFEKLRSQEHKTGTRQSQHYESPKPDSQQSDSERGE